MEKEKRRYGGASFADRQSERRERLIKAAIDVFGRAGREGATVAAICSEAGLTARYFYESFPNRDALFLEAFRTVQRELLSEIGRRTGTEDPVRDAVAAFFGALASHPGQARVFLLDPQSRESEMIAASLDTAQRLGKLFAPGAKSELALAGSLGAVIQIARRWIASGFAEKLEDVVATALLFLRAAGVAPRSA